MTRDLQIIQQLQSKFGEFNYKISNDKVIKLILNTKGVETKNLKLIGELTSLETLGLLNNKIEIIQDLNSLVNLQNLDLRFNQITKIEGLENLINLEWLDLEFNQITKIEGLDTLANLQTLNLSYNQITEIGGIKKLTNLRKLDLGYNQIETIQNLDKLVDSKELWVELGFNKILGSEKRGFKTIRTENSRIDITYNM